MALKKSQIYSSLWQSCDQLRGGMDASQYKDYVLTLLFMKYVSDKNAGVPGAMIDIPTGGGFADMVKLKGDKEIGDKINKIIGRLAEANDLKGVIDQADFNDESKLGRGKEMQDKLSKLIAIFEDLDFRSNRTEGDDLLGDAYEYLMRHFATESGKSKGQFYTPAEVSRVMAQVVGIGSATRQDQTIYDPTCGSGSLLLKAADEAPRGMTIYGQEMDNATWALACMNLILHGHPTAEIWRGNTLSDPYFKQSDGGLKTFDFAVANPPFSTKAWSTGLDPTHDEYKRFVHGIPPKKNGDYAFLLHLISSINSRGRGAIILPHGILFRGNKEANIRKSLVNHGLVEGIIGLPANLFYGTGIAACILVIDKQNAHARAGIFMIDASNGYLKDGNKNRLRSEDIRKIVDVFNERIELPRYSRMVPVTEISTPVNEFNLNIPRYIDSGEPENIHDLGAHLHGGIPNHAIDTLDDYWVTFPTLRQALFRSNALPHYSEAIVESSEVQTVIRNHLSFVEHQQSVVEVFHTWCKRHKQRLESITVGSHPKETIEALSGDLLIHFSAFTLLDPYHVYQQLMEYWDEVMQDDLYLVASEGWSGAASPRDIIQDSARKIKENPDLIVRRKKYKMDLVSPDLIKERYFIPEQTALIELAAKHEAIAGDRSEFIKEYITENELLEKIATDTGTISKSSVKARLQFVGERAESDNEQGVLCHLLTLLESEEKMNKAVNSAKEMIDQKVLSHYDLLTEPEIKSLVIQDKWFSSIGASINRLVEDIAASLTRKIENIIEYYAQPLDSLEQEIEALDIKVKSNLSELNRSAESNIRLSGSGEHWNTKRLGDFVSIRNCKVTPFDLPKDTLCVELDDIEMSSGMIRSFSTVQGTSSIKYRFCAGDVLFGRLRPYLRKYWHADCAGVCSTEIWPLVVDPTQADSGFLYLIVQSDQFLKVANISYGTHMPRADWHVMRNFETRLPPIAEQQAIASFVHDMDTEIVTIEKLCNKKRSIKHDMMRQLLTGRLRITQFDGSTEREQVP